MANKSNEKKEAILLPKLPKTKDEVFIFAEFFVFFIMSFALFYFLASLDQTRLFAKLIVTITTSTVLSFLFNEKPIINYKNNDFSLYFQEKDLTLLITDLCTGLAELTLLSSLIIASKRINVKERLKGLALALFATYAINTVRITVTSLAILHLEISFAELIHNTFFKLSLFIAIFFIYYFWITNAEKQSQHSN